MPAVSAPAEELVRKRLLTKPGKVILQQKMSTEHYILCFIVKKQN